MLRPLPFLALSLAAILAAACSADVSEEDDLSSADAVSMAAGTDTTFPTLVSEKDFPPSVVRTLKERARKSSVRLASSGSKATLTVGAFEQNGVLLVGIVAEQGQSQTLKDLQAFTRSRSGVALVKHASVKNVITVSTKGGAQLLAASARTEVAGTEKVASGDYERATSTALLTAYMAIAAGERGEKSAPRPMAASRPIMMEQDNRCSGLDPLGQWSLYVPQRLDFDVLSCCQAHDAAISCNCDTSAGATLGDNLRFISCVDGKANEAFKKLPWYAQIGSAVLFALERAILIDLIGTAVVHIGTEGSHQRGNLCGKDSCVCGGSKPTVGADPTRCKRGVDPHVCTYADYEYKMLCRGKPSTCGGGITAAAVSVPEGMQ